MSIPLPTPTVRQVVDAAAATNTNTTTSVDFTAKAAATVADPTTINMNSSVNQTQIPSVVGSQPSSNKDLNAQFQTPQVESISMEEGFTRPLTEDEIMRMPGIEARSFNSSGDEIKVLPVNHNYVLRWVQCGDYRGAGTNWLAKQMARGFEYATANDLQSEYREKFKADATGHLVIPPDLVLMKIQAALYYGYLKANMIESIDRISDKGANQRARNKAMNDMKEAGVTDKGTSAPGIRNFDNNLEKSKVSFYDPTQAGRI